MDRQLLDSLHRALPVRAFRKALAGDRLDQISFSFLHEHIDELDADLIIQLLGKPVAEDVEVRVAPFIRKLADEIIKRGDLASEVDLADPRQFPRVVAAMRALDLSRSVPAEAWLDLTQQLRGQLPKTIWYLFVDRVCGGRIFNALNQPPPGLREKDFLGPLSQERHEPLSVPLLDEPFNDLAAVVYVLSLPVNTIIDVHARIPDLVRIEDVQSVVSGRVRAQDERWVPPFPEWMAPCVVERLHHCADEEARDLFEWLATQPRGSHGGDLFEIVVARFKLVPLTREWHPLIGGYLTKGKAWKTRGRSVIEFCVDYNRGFPPGLVKAALDGAAEQDGASGREHRDAILRSMHDIAARVFVERADDALKRGNWDWGRKLLCALTSLDPGSFVAPPLRYLRKVPDVPDDVIRLVDACEQLAHSGGRTPSESAFHEAFFVLSGQVS